MNKNYNDYDQVCGMLGFIDWVSYYYICDNMWKAEVEITIEFDIIIFIDVIVEYRGWNHVNSLFD